MKNHLVAQFALVGVSLLLLIFVGLSPRPLREVPTRLEILAPEEDLETTTDAPRATPQPRLRPQPAAETEYGAPPALPETNYP